MVRRKSTAVDTAADTSATASTVRTLQLGRVQRSRPLLYLLSGVALGYCLASLRSIFTDSRDALMGTEQHDVPSVTQQQQPLMSIGERREVQRLPGTTMFYYPPRATQLVRYFHPPKTGSGFFNVLFYTLCSGFDETLQTPWLMGDEVSRLHGQKVWKSMSEFTTQYPIERHCKGTMYLPPEDVPIDISYNYSSAALSRGIHGFDGWAGPFTHAPVSPDDIQYHGTLAGLFRDPTERAASAFHHNRHLFGGNSSKEERWRLDLAQWVRFHGVAGCQAKMLLGRNCGADYNVTEADLQVAVEMLRNNFLFIGLTEYFDATVILWHRMVVGGPIYDFETKNTRLRHSARSFAKHNVDDINKGYPGENWVDHADERIYAEATRIFRERCAQYGVPLDQD